MDPSKMQFLQSVLRYSTAHADGTSSTNEATREMSPERKEWLQTALDSMSVNPIDEIKKCMKVVANEDNSESEERQLQGMQTLIDWCEDLNFAIDFVKLDGCKLITGKLLNNKNDAIRAMSCELVGTCAQNNPYCQEAFINARLLPVLLYKLDRDTHTDVKVKALFAISCLTRDYEPGQKKLLEGSALDILIRALDSSVEKLQIKSCFLCSSMCRNGEIKAELTNRQLLAKLIVLYCNDGTQNIHEHLLSAINVLIENNPQAVKQAKDMKEINFKQVLEQRLELIKGDPRHQEEKEMATTIYESLLQN